MRISSSWRRRPEERACSGPATGVARAAFDRLTAESGRLQVLDWAGYGNDGGQAMFAQYVKAHPANKPQFTYMTNESDALGEDARGLQAGHLPPVRRVGRSTSRRAGSSQPWDT